MRSTSTFWSRWRKPWKELTFDERVVMFEAAKNRSIYDDYAPLSRSKILQRANETRKRQIAHRRAVEGVCHMRGIYV